jgi:potassium channel subfamily K
MTIFFTLVGIGVVSGAIGVIANAFLEKKRELAKAAQQKMLDQAAEIGASAGHDNEATDEENKPDNGPEQIITATSDAKTDALQPAEKSIALPPLNPVSGPEVVKKDDLEDKLAVPKPSPPKLKKQPTFVPIPVKESKTKHMIDKATLFAKKLVVGLKVAIPIYVYFAASFVLGHMEGWSGVDSIYFSVITLTTVGFGDVTPQTQGGRIFASFLLPIGLITFTIVLGGMGEELAKVGKKGGKTLKQLLKDLQDVIEQDDDGTVSEEEYIIFSLKQDGKVDDDTLDILSKQFKALDADGSGELDGDDVKLLSAKCDELHLE